MKKVLFTAIMLIMAVVASAKDIKTVVLTTTPVMNCEKCAAKIKENLKYCKGVQEININVEHQAIAIKYDADKTNVDTFVQSLKKINYTATEKKCDGSCKQAEAAHKCSGDCKKKAEAEGCCKKKAEGEGCCKKKAEAEGCCKKKAEAEGCCKKKAEGEGCKKAEGDKKCDGSCKK